MNYLYSVSSELAMEIKALRSVILLVHLGQQLLGLFNVDIKSIYLSELCKNSLSLLMLRLRSIQLLLCLLVIQFVYRLLRQRPMLFLCVLTYFWNLTFWSILSSIFAVQCCLLFPLIFEHRGSLEIRDSLRCLLISCLIF